MFKIILWGLIVIAITTVLYAVFVQHQKVKEIMNCVMSTVLKGLILYCFLYLLARSVLYVFVLLLMDSSNAWLTSSVLISAFQSYLWLMAIVAALCHLVYRVLLIPSEAVDTK